MAPNRLLVCALALLASSFAVLAAPRSAAKRCAYVGTENSSPWPPLTPLSGPNPNLHWLAEVRQFVRQKKATPVDLQFWDGRIVVASTEQPHTPPQYWCFTAGDLRPQKLIVPGIDHIVSLTTCDGKPVALGRTGWWPVLMRKEGTLWSRVTLPLGAVLSPYTSLVRCDHGLGLLAGWRFYRQVDGVWQKPVALGVVPRFDAEYEPKGYGGTQYVYRGQFFAGWDEGEQGGQLVSLDLDHPAHGWRLLSGYPKSTRGPDGGETTTSDDSLKGTGVTGMTLDAAGQLWVCKGCAHLGYMWRELSEFDGRHWKRVVRGEDIESVGGRIDFPGKVTDIRDVDLGPDGRLYVLAGELGVFVYEHGQLRPVVPIRFYEISCTEAITVEGRKDYEVYGCFPRKLAVDQFGNIFVATYSTGVLCFLKDGASYHLRQARLPETGGL